MVTDIELGKYLAHLRDRTGLKQNELAEKVGWSASVLSRVESGERSMSTGELQTISEAIGTEEALSLRETVGRNWQNLPKPPLGHPNEPLLWGRRESSPKYRGAFSKAGCEEAVCT